ncbi:putative thiol oxidoreductase [Pseudoalteromonas luteoviolacea 2ta16]|uniref:Putative thiol oxidoreductase n=2 Tax=Pseudoalteromonas luteoviolacea TaxID=43657 RepID=V4H7B7_PSEL2|nr:putative thiol oxidoreductase [Pseudoalteromonas luteoviolacea 2ta16]
MMKHRLNTSRATLKLGTMSVILVSTVVGCNIFTNEEKPEEPNTFQFSDSGIRKISPDLYVAFPKGGNETPQRVPSIDQDTLLAGGYSLNELLEAGQNQFNVPFDPANGHGEGAQGPRSKQRYIWNNRGGTDKDPAAWPFLRVNGLDSQSCFECHNTIGQYTPNDAKTIAQVRKPATQGGSAAVASNAFINDQFPEELYQLLGTDPNTKAVMTKFVRNPPHVFGTGYTQRLATEMTTELQAQVEATKMVARLYRNDTQSIQLTSKGIKFGRYSVTCKKGGIDDCDENTSKVVGVQKDFVVRPFQWGGISSTVRHFARDALDFHFSVQAVEKVGNKDCDQDGLIDEITVGNVTALTAYVSMFRPPIQPVYDDKSAQVPPGKALFEQVGCINCHTSSLTIDNPTLTIMTPPDVPDDEACPREVAQLINPADRLSGAAKEAMLQIEHAFQNQSVLALTRSNTLITPEKLYQTALPHLHTTHVKHLAEGNYQIDLNLSGYAHNQVPDYVWPRLFSENGASTSVPLYSDLKLHFMGKKLSDNYPQPTDTKGYAAQPGVYVTRPLWGVGDTAPYMHDGRARTLLEAIQLHGAEGSEAKKEFDNFNNLSAKEQQALIEFLESLKLPIQEGVSEVQYVSK